MVHAGKAESKVMIVGTVREIKNHEYRVGLTPESVHELTAHGHDVLVESGAGEGIGAHDVLYERAGGRIVSDAADIFAAAEMIVKVKEPQPDERAMLRPGQILYTYLHLAPDPEQTRDLMASGAVCIAYETVTDGGGGLPLLKPMSQVAGRMSIQAGATALEKAHGGRGVLLGGVPGVLPAKVAVIGGGVVGFNAAQMAAGLGADVTVLDRDPQVLERLGTYFEARAKTRFSNRANLAECVADADLVIGAVLIPGAAAPKLVSAEMLKTMKKGAVLVDVAIDQGGCFETSRPTTHAEPTYVIDGIVHYCVANMPGAVARTSTYALNNVTLPHALRIADLGWREAMRRDPHLLAGLNVWDGKVTYRAVADDLDLPYTPATEALG
ncbi:alanine dehydrogenase [Sphingobium cloacae]|uniref:Alanine dehydrogenase n=2 Tax=Sphingobium cloacae TaxID=120107 RepID=A0A1E1F366_9SPHN|nr:alanine dehydrogenase [Sphingobium cloacae]